MTKHSNILMQWAGSWFDQLLLQRAPQDDVYAPRAMAAALLAYIAVDMLQAVSSSAWRVAWAITFTDTLLMVLFPWAVLQIARKPARLVQTVTALAGTGALLGMVGVPLVWQAARSHQAGGSTPSAVLLGWLVLLIWTVTVQAHIFRHALSTRYGFGLMLAGLYSVIAIVTLETLFPRVLQQTTG